MSFSFSMISDRRFFSGSWGFPVMAQVNTHSTDQVMHGLFPKRLTDLVLDSMTDHEKLSTEILESDESQRKFALLILRILSNRQPSRSEERRVGKECRYRCLPDQVCI